MKSPRPDSDLLRPLVERERNDCCDEPPATNVDLERLTGLGQGDGHIGHADGLLEERRLGAARDVPDLVIAVIHVVPLTGDAPVHHLEADETTADALRALR